MERGVLRDPLSVCSWLRWRRVEVRVVQGDHRFERWLPRVVPVDPLLGCRVVKLMEGCGRAVLLDPHCGCCVERVVLRDPLSACSWMR